MPHKEMISIVIPCYGSENTIEGVVTRIQKLMTTALAKYDFEIILVNDASPDNVRETIWKLANNDPEHIIGVDLVRNFGQHSALMAGYRQSSGDYIVSLDDDGQTPPEAIIDLLDKLLEGFDVVYAAYKHKKHSIFRNLGSKVNDFMNNKLLGKPKNLYISSYFIAKRLIIDEIIKYQHSFPYMQGLVLRTTKRITNCYVSHQERESGSSGYTLVKLIRLLLNGLTAFSVVPLRLATFCGLMCALFGFLGIIIVVCKKLAGVPVPLGYSAIMVVILFLGGMIMLMLGIIGEYVGRSYLCINHSPQYVIRSIVNNTKHNTK